MTMEIGRARVHERGDHARERKGRFIRLKVRLIDLPLAAAPCATALKERSRPLRGRPWYLRLIFVESNENRTRQPVEMKKEARNEI